MNNTYESSYKSMVSLRRTIGILALILSIVTIVAILLGIVPIYKQSGDVITVGENLFLFLGLMTKPIYYIAFRIIFSIIYIILVVKSVKDLIVMFKASKFWIKDENDTKIARTSITNCVAMYNDIFIRLIALLVASYAFDSFKLRLLGKLLLIALSVCQLVINVLRMYLVKRNFWDSVFSPLSSSLVLTVLMLFMFNIYNVNISVFCRQLGGVGRVLIRLTGTVSSAYIVQVVVTQIVLPILYIVVLFKLLHLFTESISYGIKYSGYIDSCKRTMIANIVICCIVVAAQMISERNTNPAVFFSLIMNYMEFILLSVSIFLLSKNQGSSLPDAPVCEDLAQPAEEQFKPENVQYSAVEVDGFTFDVNEFNY